MLINFASQTEIENWNNLIVANPDGGNIFQTTEFAAIKQANNWTPLQITVGDLHILILQRKVPLLGVFWYVPKGPGITSAKELKEILPDLRNFAKKHKVFAVKLEPELLETPENIKKLTKYGLQKSRAIQAANTAIVDLDKSIDEIMASFSSKTRGNIRAGQKAEVTTEITPITDENCEKFYAMMTQTINGRSPVRSFEYFKTFWQLHYNAGTGIFMFAKLGDEILSMDFIMILGTKATRKDAGSTRDHTIRGASALLEFEAIKYLKEKGVTKYDLYGSPPSDQIKNPNHPYYGFGTFKVGFSAEITDFIGCYDLVVEPLVYKIWRKFGEKVVRRIYKYKYHDSYY